METPVIYFYTPRPLHASVSVDFPRGLISQWFPTCRDANLISARSGEHEEIEKFIFYRGVANFVPPIVAKFVAGDTTTIKINNTGTDDLAFVFVYEKPENGSARAYWQGKVEKGESRLVDRKEKGEADFAVFEKALVEAGLYPKEAKAMLETWRSSYFEKKGIRIFWIAPENWVNKILPLQITPRPKETRRVFVQNHSK